MPSGLSFLVYPDRTVDLFVKINEFVVPDFYLVDFSFLFGFPVISINNIVLAVTAAMLLIAGLIPKFSALLTTIPQCVLGGATVSVFASIAMTGMKLVAMQPMSYRNTSIVGLSAALGMGVSMVSESLSQFPEWVTMVFASSPVVIAAIVAILLNIILPDENKNS